MHMDMSEKHNRKRFIARALMAVAAIVLSCTFLIVQTGCANQQSLVNSEEQQEVTASEYMVKLNQAASTLRENLEGFASAVESGDITTLQSKCDAAFQGMDELNDLNIPDELKDLKSQYDEAVSSLQTSLNDYIALYTDIASEPNQNDIDLKKYSERFEKVQKEYDTGMNLLEKADDSAKSL